MTNIEELKMYREIIIDINTIYNMAMENEYYNNLSEYLSNQTNELYGIDPSKDKPKVKVLRLYS